MNILLVILFAWLIVVVLTERFWKPLVGDIKLFMADWWEYTKKNPVLMGIAISIGFVLGSTAIYILS